MAGEVFQNRKRKSRGENIQNNGNESAKRSKQYTTQNQDEKQFLTPEKHASGPHNTDPLNLTVRSLIFHRTTSQPPLPGTPCQFVQTSSGSSILGTERMESKTNVAINNFTTEKRMSPDSGITNTPTNTTSSPDLSLAHAHSSGIGSLQAMECNDEDMQLVNSQTSDEVDYIKMKMETRNITSSTKQKRMQKFLQRKFVFLKNELIPSGIVDRLLSDQIITDQDNDDICRVEGRGQKCEFLIKAVNRSLENSDACAVQKIEAAFSTEGYDYIFKDYKEYSMSGKRKSPPGSSSLWKEKLKSFEPKLEDDLDPRFFIDQLVSEEVLEFDEHQNISDVTFKPEKINCLIKYLHRKTEQTFNDFCKVLKKAYSKNTFVDKLCSSHEIEELKEPDANPQVSLVSREEQDCRMTPSATAHITFRFDGEAKDIEQMIVDDNNPSPNESLQEEVMDIGAYEIVKTTFSSIRIVLSALSHSSEMQIVKKCKQSPVFLMKLLQNLIKPEHLKMLEERGIKRIFFEIKVKLPGSEHISKTDIVRNKDLLCNELNKVEILQFLGETDITDHVKAIEDIKKAETNTQCVMKFVEFIVSEGNETYLEAFLEFLKKHNKDELITQLSRLQSCSCKISKKNIVEHYSLIEKELTDVDTIIKAFSEYADFPADLKDKFKSVLNSSHPEVKVDTFLRHLLALPDDGIQLCLLEERLHATDQVALLDKITKMSEKNEGIQVTDDDIRRNRLYLCDELEPKQYREMVKEIDETDNLSEQILEATSRESRCEVLLDFISKACKTDSKAHILSKFSQSLLKWNAGVLQYIKKTRKPVQEGKRQMEIENIIASYKHIVDEIEPLSLIRFFEEREELTEDEIRCIRRSSSRRARAVTFLNFVLKGTESKVSCLIDYLRFAGYNSLLKKMRECMQKYKECPRLYAFDLKDCYVLKGDLDINFNNEKNTQEQEPSNVPKFDNWSLVTNWVLENFFSQKREFEEQKTQEIREDTQSLQDEAKCSTSYENVLCIPDVQNEKTESTYSALQYNESETKLMETCSECDTPMAGSTVPNQTPTDLISNGQKTSIPMSVQYLRKFIVKNFVLLKSEIDPVELIDTLCNEGVISSEIVEKLKNERLRAGKCDLLLKSIFTSTYRNDDHDILLKVKLAFDSAGYGHVVKSLENKLEKVIHETDESHLSKEESQKLDSIYPFDDDEIEPLTIIDDLVSEEILSLEEHQDIKIAETRKLRLNLVEDKMISLTGRDLNSVTRILKQQYSSLNVQLKAEKERTIIGNFYDPKPTVHLNNTGKVCRIGSLVDPKPTVHLNNGFFRTGEVAGHVDDGTLVKMYFSCPGQEQHAFYSSLDFDDRLDDVVLESGFEIVPIMSSMNNIIILKSLSSISKIEFLLKCCDSVKFLEEWFQLICIKDHTEGLRQNHITEISVKIEINILDNQQVTCPCMLAKEVIFRHYSSLERNLESADEIIATFSRFKGFDRSTQLFFKNLLDGPGNRTELFLLKLLDTSCTRIHLCLLEHEMRKKNLKLLKQVTVEQKSDTEYRLTAEHIRKNMTFLSNELEPRHFTRILTGLTGSESILEKIMLNEPRQERCRTLINFIIQKKIHRRFIQELERQNKAHLVEIITAHRNFDGLGDIKYSLIKNYRRIIDEIEPNLFREIFVERRDITKIEYEDIWTLPTRRLRAKRLMRVILKGSKQIGKSFLDALEISGYSYLLKVLTTNIEPQKMCPILFKWLPDNNGELVITSRFKLEFDDVPKPLTEKPALSNYPNWLTSLLPHTPLLPERDMRKHRIEENASLQEEANTTLQRTLDWIKPYCQQEHN